MASKRSKQLARAQQQQAAAQQLAALTVSQTISGPLPAAVELERYDAIVPGMAERLLVQFERQGEHRMGLETQVVQADIKRADRGLTAGIGFGIVLLAVSTMLILTGHEQPGTLLLIGEFVTFAGTLLYTTVTRRQERDRKLRGE